MALARILGSILNRFEGGTSTYDSIDAPTRSKKNSIVTALLCLANGKLNTGIVTFLRFLSCRRQPSFIQP